MKPIVLSLLCLAPFAHADDTAWPQVTNEAKPWTRWWWLGSGVDAKNLTAQLEAFSKAGIGGVEICPIYGAKGFEDRDLQFLSKEWTDAYAHTAKESARLGMGVDLTTGTGWPFGGPWVEQSMASSSLESVKTKAEGGKPLTLALPKGTVEVLSAWPEQGEAKGQGQPAAMDATRGELAHSRTGLQTRDPEGEACGSRWCRMGARPIFGGLDRYLPETLRRSARPSRNAAAAGAFP